MPRAKTTSTSGHGAAAALGVGPASGAIAANRVAAATPIRRAGVMVGSDTLKESPRSRTVGLILTYADGGYQNFVGRPQSWLATNAAAWLAAPSDP